MAVVSSMHPIAPKMTKSDEVSSSTSKKVSPQQGVVYHHPTLGYAIPPPQPAKVARRNARERNRVKQVNGGFELLRSHIPSAAKHKKMSKVSNVFLMTTPKNITSCHDTSVSVCD